MDSQLFKRTIEDFACENCSQNVKGDGYTNHCPSCLWSKHVDINPGDRAHSCGGLMAPVDVLQEKGEHILMQQCKKCGVIKRIKARKEDNFEKMLEIARLKE